MSRPLLLSALLCLALPCLAAERVALVIGNGAYKDAKLPNPMNDAQLVEASLRKTGFKVIEKTDLTRDGMRAAIREFSDALGKGDTALFYYAGHGAQVRDENYLLPVDAPLGMREFEAEDRSVKINLALAAMEECGSALNIVILDCCRDNPFARSWRSATRGLAEMKAPQETLIAYATAPGKAASDGAGSNSPYSQALAEEILRPGVKLQDVFLNVARRVHAATEGEQRPWTASDLLGEFVFVAAKSSVAQPSSIAPAATPSPTPAPATIVQTPPATPAPSAAYPNPVFQMPPSSSSAAYPNPVYPPPAPAGPPPGPTLPASGFFDLDALFTGSAYASYNSYSRAQILKQAQAKLKTAGHYSSSADGAPGPGTQRGILAYQQANNLPLTGKLDTATLGSLGLTGIQPMTAPKLPPRPTASRATAPSQPTQSDRSKAETSEIDANLKLLEAQVEALRRRQ